MYKRRGEKGFSLIELLIAVAIILIIAAIAIPNLLRSKVSANEASAVGSLRTIMSATNAYSATYNIGFPSTLAKLCPAKPATSAAADLIDSVLCGGVKSGYTFSYVAGAVAGGTIATYTLNGDPLSAGQTGQRRFYADQSGVIRFNASATAGIADKPIS